MLLATRRQLFSMMPSCDRRVVKKHGYSPHKPSRKAPRINYWENLIYDRCTSGIQSQGAQISLAMPGEHMQCQQRAGHQTMGPHGLGGHTSTQMISRIYLTNVGLGVRNGVKIKSILHKWLCYNNLRRLRGYSADIAARPFCVHCWSYTRSK